MVKEVKVLKLLSGEEIITRIKSLDDDSDKYVCEKPMITQPVPIQGGQMAMGMSAWMFAGNIDEVENARSSVIAITSAKREIENKYIEMITGITTAITGPTILKG